jgi:hypothetical protein
VENLHQPNKLNFIKRSKFFKLRVEPPLAFQEGSALLD